MNNSSNKIGENDSFFLTNKDLNMKGSPSKHNQDSNDKAQNPITKLNRIQKFRRKKGSLIGAHKIPESENIDSIFNSDHSLQRHVSLSLYTQPNSLVSKKSDYDRKNVDIF